MRKVTEETTEAFMDNKNCSKGNTVVKVEDGFVNMYFHGHKIARKNIATGVVEINNCNYETNVTKERLCGIIDRCSSPNDRIYQQSFVWYWKRGEMFLPNRWHQL